MTPLSIVAVGQQWSWDAPNGTRRTMIVQRFTDIGRCRRAFGIHPQSGKRLQVPLVWLMKGTNGARLDRVVENYEFQPVRQTTKAGG